ncbi:MAG: protein translocase subunit SecDF [Rikenellaceae bacterium]|jgi:SecD/SecF fusion protein|nr:protein translocase subunit SecDF [Rikenellaceae bacterium]
MQNKGALKFLAVALAVACAYQLSFTFVTRSVERQAERYASAFDTEQHDARVTRYLDSIKAKPVYDLWFIDFTYKECKEKEINLGLDLKGGMNVMLEVSVRDIIAALSNDSKDPLFRQALDEATTRQKNSSGDYITYFAEAYARLSNNAPLAYIFNTPKLKELVRPGSTNDEVIEVLREQSEAAINNSYTVLSNRIDRFGVVQPNIQKLENSGRILVELPGVKDPERVRKLLQGTASLEFWATYENSEIFPALVQADQLTIQTDTVRTEQPAGVAAAADTTGGSDELASLIGRQGDSTATPGLTLTTTSLLRKLSPNVDQANQPGAGSVIGRALSADTAAINRYLAMPAVRNLMPRDARFMWSIKSMTDPRNPKVEIDIFELHAIKANTRDGRAPLDGGAVTDAKEQYSQSGSSAEVSMSMNSAGSRIWARLTADNIGHCVAIVLDGYVYSAPRVNNEISGGHSQITGNFTIQEAQDLANVLKSGKLPAPARVIQDTVVGPSLGQESIDAGMMSFILAFVLVLLYMLSFYSSAGLVANVVLIINLFFLFGVLVSFGMVLTLPGIAGIVLTMGMAVDANVIIYERIKEEVKSGKGLNLSVSEGFKHAMSAIVDSNLTTIITGLVMMAFGTGPIRGFATTLVIGIITSFFTSVFISRLIFVALLDKGRKPRFAYGFNENFLGNVRFNFVGVRKFTYIISAALIVLTAASLFTRGMDYGVDFSGGRAYVVRFDRAVTIDEVRNRVEAALPGSFEIKQYGAEDRHQMRIVTQYKSDETGDEVNDEINALLYTALSPLYDTPLTEVEFTTTQQNPNGIINSDKVGPSVASDIKRDAVIAVLFALIAIGIYIAFRFRKWQWGLGAIVSIAHDVIITLGMVSLLHSFLPFNLDVDQAFVAAILTIVGYSINDTVVIFDRIREYGHLYPKRVFSENINNAINSTLSRTVNTLGTTVVTLLAIFLFGGEVIRGFVFTLMLGIVLGTFSSVFVATPISYDIFGLVARRKANK